MKNVSRVSFLVVLATVLTVYGRTANVSLSWDANPPSDKVGSYHVYELKGSNRNLLGSTTSLSYTILNEKAGPHTYAVSADNGVEGPLSNSVNIKL